LRDEMAHPGAALLALARVVIGEEQAKRRTAGFEDLENLHVRMVGRQILPTLKTQPIELCRHVEDAFLQHALELEVGTHRGAVELVARLALSLEVVMPV